MQNESRTKKKWQKVVSHRLIFEKNPIPFLKRYLNVIVFKIFIPKIEFLKFSGNTQGLRGKRQPPFHKYNKTQPPTL
jgi:hypothetical protein